MTKTEDCQKNQVELLEINNTVPEIKNLINGLNIAKESSSVAPSDTGLGPVLWSSFWPSSNHKEPAWLRI